MCWLCWCGLVLGCVCRYWCNCFCSGGSILSFTQLCCVGLFRVFLSSLMLDGRPAVVGGHKVMIY